MNIKLNYFRATVFAALAMLFFLSCQKMERPKLDGYPQDANPPGGPLKFYTAFNGTSNDPLRNAVDSVRANFAVSNPFSIVDGISGKAVKGLASKDKGIKYTSANDFAKATSVSVAYWVKHAPQTDGEPEFHFSLPSKDFWHESALFLLVEKSGPNNDNSTPTQMACTFALQDHWVEFRGVNRLPNVLDGNWHHLAFVYSEATSIVTAYVDGVAKAYTGGGNNIGLGALQFKNVSNFVIGGWNKHASVSGPTDGWIHSYSGAMDQFRLYGKALTASEIQALYNSRL
jgi:hypothetical protein